MNNEVDKNSKLNSLQGLRLLAFLLIYLNHSFWLLGIGKIFDFGARGVEIFFVLSGFLVAYNYGDRVFDCSWKNCTLYAYNKLKKFYILHFITFLLFLYYPIKEYIRGGTKFHKNPYSYNWLCIKYYVVKKLVFSICLQLKRSNMVPEHNTICLFFSS